VGPPTKFHNHPFIVIVACKHCVIIGLLFKAWFKGIRHLSLLSFIFESPIHAFKIPVFGVLIPKSMGTSFRLQKGIQFGTKMHNYHEEIPTWPKTEPEINWRHQSNVGNKCRSFSGNVRDIWTKFGIKAAQETDKQHSGMCHIHLSWKSNMAAAAILDFEKCLSPDWIGIHWLFTFVNCG